MKAFVIKNKEGKYYDYWADCMIDKLDSTCIYLEKEQAEKDIVNCKSEDVVEITIAEGDLEEENKQLKEQLNIREKALELACHDFIRDKVGMLTDTELYDYFIEQAKENMK